MNTIFESTLYFPEDHRDPFSMSLDDLEELVLSSSGETKAYLTGILHDRQMTSVVLGVGQ